MKRPDRKLKCPKCGSGNIWVSKDTVGSWHRVRGYRTAEGTVLLAKRAFPMQDGPVIVFKCRDCGIARFPEEIGEFLKT